MSEVSAMPEKRGRLAPRKRAGGVVVPHRPRLRDRAAACVIAAIARAVIVTLRIRWNDQSDFTNRGKAPAIYCIWHNRLGLSMKIYHGYVRRKTASKGLAAMVSASRDGGFLSAILECFKVQPVRGSSSRRGPQALLELTTWAERGYDLAITPDGPRGPCYVVQEGVMSLAQLTGLPIVPVSYHTRWKLRVKSWDRFQIPLPFALCEIRFGKPIFVPRETSDAERAALRQQLQKSMMALSCD